MGAGAWETVLCSCPDLGRAVPRSSPSKHKNHLLARMSPQDRELLQPKLQPVELPVEHMLEEANKPIEYVYFLESGFTSLVAFSTKHRKIEVGIIGREGVSSPAVV